MSRMLWSPSDTAGTDTQIAKFAARILEHEGFDWCGDYHNLWQYSVDHRESFWSHFWDWHGIIGTKGNTVIANPEEMTGGQFFPDGQLNYAENMLFEADDTPAIIAHAEGQPRRMLTRHDLAKQVKALAGWLQEKGVEPAAIGALTENTRSSM